MSEYTPTTEHVRDLALRLMNADEFDRWLAKVKADAVREHEERPVVIHMDPPAPAVRYVAIPCPRCGWSR